MRINKKKLAAEVIELLRGEYPEVKCALIYEKPHELLIATRLSAQCTDKRVNMVTPALFERFGSIDEFAAAEVSEVEEYIRTCKRYDKVGVLEFKTVYKPEHIAEMVDIIRREDYLDGIIFISFALDNLIHLREILPGHPCQFLTGEWNDALIPTLVEHKMDLDIYWEQLTEERIALCHQNGIVVNAWTVDDPGAGEKLAAWGIDYITSNILE